jgi:TolB-like protein
MARRSFFSAATVVLALGLAVPAAAADKPPPKAAPTPIAVLDFQAASGAPTEAVQAMAAKVRAYIVDLENYSLIDKANMDKVLEEQKLALKFCALSDASCLLQVGKQLAVREIVTGRISQVGDKYFITIEHTDTQSARLLHSFTDSCRCDDEELIEKADAVADDFFSGAPRKARVRGDTRIRPDVLKITGAAVLVGGGALAAAGYLKAMQARNDYEDATTQAKMDSAHGRIVTGNKNTTIGAGIAGLGAVVLFAGFADGWWGASGVALRATPSSVLFAVEVP